MTLIPDTTIVSQTKPPLTQPKRSKLKRILKKSKRPETQVDSGELESRVTRLEKTVSAMSRFNLVKAINKSIKAHLNNVLPKDIPDFGKIKMEKATKKELAKAYNRHPAHRALYDALAVSLSIDEDDMDKELEEQPVQKKRRRDDHDQDPLTNTYRYSKKKKRKYSDSVQADETIEELIQEMEMDDEELAKVEVVNDDEHLHDNAAPKLR
ncbi:hypothetical protein Tco_1500992 [Tanacetum coccineum]